MDAEVARRSDELKTALVASVSHDLRTPLASIRAAAGNLADPEVPWEADEVRTAARSIDTEAERLDRLVRGLLDLSRIEAGALRPRLEACDLASMVDEVVDRLRPNLGQRAVTVDVPESLPPVRVDALLFDQLLTNLVDNAARHAPAPAPLVIRGRELEGGEPRVELVVEDGGPGVPRAALATLFDGPARMARQGAGSGRGTGTGLIVVSGFARAMEVDLAATAGEIGGLAITLRIPAEGAPVDLAQ
jgi:two-component system sensor histidine kinase KdpD